jgi:hypothetical protein
MGSGWEGGLASLLFFPLSASSKTVLIELFVNVVLWVLSKKSAGFKYYIVRVISIVRSTRRANRRVTMRGIVSRRVRVIGMLAGALFFSHFVSGCATLDEMNHVLQKVDSNWSAKNRETTKAFGSKIFDAEPDKAYLALEKTIKALGFKIKERNPQKRYILAQAPAPVPLSDKEWATVEDVEEPIMQSMASDTLPITSLLFFLHTDGVEIHVNGTVTRETLGTRVKFDYTMIDRKVMAMGLTPVQTPPPTAVRIGLVKAWTEFERQLKHISY